MNKIILKGRLSKDIETRKTTTGVSVISTSIAVNRKQKNEDGSYTADFFNLTAFGSLADFISNYFTKGQEILIEGRLQNRSWEDQNGQKRYATDIIVESAEFCGAKKEDKETEFDFVTVDTSDEELPF